MLRTNSDVMGINEIGRLSRLFKCSLTSMAVRLGDVGNVVTFGSEFGEVSWHCGTGRTQIVRPRAQFKSVASFADEMPRGREVCTIETREGGTSEFVAEWCSTGLDRKLFVLTRVH
jgi:hypothetical protein